VVEKGLGKDLEIYAPYVYDTNVTYVKYKAESDASNYWSNWVHDESTSVIIMPGTNSVKELKVTAHLIRTW